ncbi:two-component regulator propeller domain-containing protein [Carboxylicivirga sp. M1479]|uniref:hybrid sensor histidine kinase/response regulator transcription factor n=1 Tax=Carboxylicivirga sp. M1479 TaxID=2594476 RepID=UPI001177D733|nr:two-component regulator propeller domain-containing protein [Carboxylicivirga sp. M1479]TRX66285.1 response regulator [Carboxylicivirga sp. M1479]
MSDFRCIRVLLLSAFVIVRSYIAFGQEYQISYLSVEDGLSHNEVTSIVQDNDGFMWFGTRGGLNRYDGYQFKHYKPDWQQTSSIQGASVECLFRDSNGHLWIGTQTGGYSYFDLVKERFVVPPGSGKLNKTPVISFDEDSKGNICISSFGNGIVKYRAEGDVIESISSGLCRSVTCVNDTLVFWGTQSGLGFVSADKVEKTIRFSKGYHDPMKIIADRQQPCIWMVGWNLNLTRYNYSNGSTTNFVIPDLPDNEAGISLMQDNAGDLWIGTKGQGLFKFSVADLTFHKVEIKPDVDNISHSDYDFILDIYQDVAGDIWVGTNGGGIVRLSANKQFYTYDANNDIGGQHITSVLEDRDGVLWVGTKGKGLFVSNGEGKFSKVSVIQNKMRSEFESEHVISIYQSENGLIWVCLESTLYVIKNNIDGSKELLPASTFFNSPSLRVRKPVDLIVLGNQLWVASEVNGLYLFEKEKSEFVLKKKIYARDHERQLVSHRGLVLNYDHRNRLWIGTNLGLHLYQAEKNSFIAVENLIDNYTTLDKTILCLHTDNSGHVWFGTPSSLNQLVEEPNGSFKLMEYTKKDGLADDYINCILSDKKGNIWLSTNAGLSMYNKQSRTFRNYDESDGIGGLNFSKTSGCIGHDGQMYFGGFNGVTYFNPEEVKDNNYNPPVAITEFKILNKPSVVNPKGAFKKSINSQQRIHLNHLQNEFSIEFSALDYKAPHLNHYAYWLEGLDSTRVLLGNRRYVSFSNLKPGDYTLRLYGTNSNGSWSDRERTLNISVSPAPWKTWYANGAYVLLIVLTVFVIVKVARRQEQLKQEVEIQKTQRVNQKKMNDDKLRFFTNISHEIRTPLTLILAPVSELLQKDFSKLGQDYVKSKIEVVYQSASKLQELVNQLLEFRKLEAGKAQLQASENNMIEFVKHLTEPFAIYAESKKIGFKTNYKLKNPTLYFDNEKMAVVVNNLLSNAFKYVGQTGEVSVLLEQDEQHIFIHISNNGSGIPPSSMTSIFERFYQPPGHSPIGSTGIGLSLVKSYIELHKGEINVTSTRGELTTFTISLLKGTSHLLADEITKSPTKEKHFEGITEKFSKMQVRQLPKAIRGDKILIVDDNEEIMKYLHGLLEQNFEVIDAKDGLEAYEGVLEHKPELVISDVMMPRMDGFELCQKIKSNELVSHIPVILLTAKGEGKDELLGTRHGADAYMIKPFNPILLLEKVNLLIESRRKLSYKFAEKVVLEPKGEVIEKDDVKLLKQIISIVEENIDNVTFTKEELATKMAMSYMTLYRKCKKMIDITPGAYIRSMRLKRAAQYLRETDMTVLEIIDKVAYADAKSFRRGFSKEFGMIPSEYRKKYKAE